jgi:hypothetical protein
VWGSVCHHVEWGSATSSHLGAVPRRHELYPTKAALDEAFIGMEGGMTESLGQLEELLAALGANR